ncbi:CPBP family intramembrane glutamic endopeptidase [Croceicoccus marinus]|uniref:CPBP family intramembrane metalloprotease n=1 Tax=Croceicoccus marinus TaxID=450378 RepID=A0A7G6VT89_9SPHN|nr:CPBP family intramembrane glutamic endopeptidase [Croceicoccus marinus]QNE04954.1 CPBP family intramembrane metalloprotease [Croceicoccus marinus]
MSASAVSIPARPWIPAVLCLGVLAPAILVPAFGFLASLALMAAVLTVIKPARRAALAFAWKSRAKSLALGIVVGGALAVGIAELVRPFVEGMLGRGVDTAGLDVVAGNWPVFLVTLVVALASAAAEEVLYRGYVIGWGARIFGRGAVPLLVLISAAAFGASHSYGPSGAVVTGLIGLALGVLYQLCGRRLLPCVAAHMTFNLIGSVALFLA